MRGWLSCKSTSAATDYLTIYGGSGGDKIGPLTSNALATAGVSLLDCGATGNYIKPFNLPMGLYAEGGNGADWIFGTDNGDIIYSQFPASGYFADGGKDKLCGFGGDDTLTGDPDDLSTAFECIDGGNGTDTCHAGDVGTGADQARACEGSPVGFATTTVSTCSCTNVASFWSF